MQTGCSYDFLFVFNLPMMPLSRWTRREWERRRMGRALGLDHKQTSFTGCFRFHGSFPAVTSELVDAVTAKPGVYLWVLYVASQFGLKMLLVSQITGEQDDRYRGISEIRLSPSKLVWFLQRNTPSPFARHVCPPQLTGWEGPAAPAWLPEG